MELDGVAVEIASLTGAATKGCFESVPLVWDT